MSPSRFVVHASACLCASIVIFNTSALGITTNLDFKVVDEASYQAFKTAISKSEYVRYKYVRDPKPRVVGAVAGLVVYATTNPLATQAQLTAFVNAHNAALVAHAPGDPDLQRSSHLVSALPFGLPLSGEPTLAGTNTDLGSEVTQCLGLDVPAPDGFNTNERRVVLFERARTRQLADSAEWSSLLVVGFSGQDLNGAPNEHLASVLGTYLTAQGYAPSPPAPAPCTPSILGTVGTPGFARGVAVSGTLAYVSVGTSGLRVIDISNSANPTIVGSVNTPGNAIDVAVIGTTAYVADFTSGLQIIDVSNPVSPVILGSVDTPGFALSVAVNGTTVYVADHASGLLVIDASNPANPMIVGSLATSGQAGSVAVSGTMAYVTDTGSRSLRVIDVSNPAVPVLVGEVGTFFPVDVALSGTTAYVADESMGLAVIDVSDPANPIVVGAVDPTEPFGLSVGVAVSGGLVFLAEDLPGMNVIDVSDPTNPVIIGSVGASIGGVAVDGPLAYATGSAGLDVIDVSGCTSPVVTALATLPANFTAYQALLADPFAPGSLWESITTCFEAVRLETVDRLTELATALANDDLVQGVANANDPAFVAARQAAYLAKLDLVADERVILSASALMMLQSASSPTRDLARHAQNFSGLQLGQNSSMAGTSESVQLAVGIGLVAFGAATANPMALAGGVMAITNGALGLGDVFGGGPSEEEQIFQQIVQMRQQIADMQFQLNGRFDRIETQLNVVFTAMAAGFNELGQMIGDLTVTVESVERDLATANAKLERIEDALWTIADVLLTQQLATLTNAVLNFRSGGADLGYVGTTSNFQNGMSELFTYATTTAKNSVYAGDTASTLTVGNAASRLNGDSIGRQINDLRVFPQTQLGLPVLLNTRVAAPSLWAQAASAYSQVARESPWYFAFMYENQLMFQVTPDLNNIIGVGQDMEDNAANGRNQMLFDRLFTDWRTTIAAVSPALDLVISTVGGGLDPWGGINQPTRQIPRLPTIQTLMPPPSDLALGFPTLQLSPAGQQGWNVYGTEAAGQPELIALLANLSSFTPTYFWRGGNPTAIVTLTILDPNFDPITGGGGAGDRSIQMNIIRRVYDCGSLISETDFFFDPALWPNQHAVLDEAWPELRPLVLSGANLVGSDFVFQEDGAICTANPPFIHGTKYFLRVNSDSQGITGTNTNLDDLRVLQDQVWVDAAADLNMQTIEDDLQGFEALLDGYITLSMPDLMERSTIARATLRADRSAGELSMSLQQPLPTLLASFQTSIDGDGDVNMWPIVEGEVFANTQLLQDEVNAAIASPPVGHSYVDYMLAELGDLQGNAFKLAIDDSYAATSGQMLMVGAGQGVMVNDVDQPFRVIEVDTAFVLDPMYVPPQNGIVSLAADGSFDYTPDPGFVGADSFNYRSFTSIIVGTDLMGNPIIDTIFSDPATVVVIVEPPALCPGDASGDGAVTFDDITSVLSNWLNDYTPGTGLGDANGDGVVTFDDITSVLSNWLAVCP